MITAKHLSRFDAIDTPFYYYDLGVFRSTLDRVKELSNRFDYHIHYAVKANSNDRILQIVKEYGFGADCVSGNEVTKSVELGFAQESIVFAGVGKTDREIITALNADIFGFNCESFQELEVIEQLAGNLGKTANVSLRINPNVDAKTHKNITTGLEENKFGINLWELDDVLHFLEQASNIKLIGLHFHIGSQVTDLSRYEELAIKANELNKLMEDKNLRLAHINLGGGLGINYSDPLNNMIPDFEAYFNIFKKNLSLRPDQTVHFELGRALVGQCGVLVTKVLYEKTGKKRHFLILDAGMTELMRPALYQATHYMENLSANSQPIETYDVVGPICETTDAFARDLSLPKSKRGDMMAIYSTGAYGEVLKNQYNLRGEVAVVYSDDLNLG